MDKTKRLDEYLNIKIDIIKPVLQQLTKELLNRGYLVEVQEGGISRDLLLNEKGEPEKIYTKRTPLLGQLSLKIRNDYNQVQVVVVGYVGGNIQIVNPKSEDISIISLNEINFLLLKKQIIEMLNL